MATFTGLGGSFHVDWVATFTGIRKQGDNSSAYANMKYQGAGYSCPFVAYLIDEDQLDTLDVYEGESRHYIRLGMPFNAANSKTAHLGHVYIAHPNKLTDATPVNDKYLNFIKQGYRQHGF